MKDIMRDELGAPKIVDRSAFQAKLDVLGFGGRLMRGKATRLAAAG